VWWFYVVDGNTAATVYDVKRHQVRAYLSRSGCPSAFVAVSTEMAGVVDPAQVLKDYVSKLEPLPSYLCGDGEKTAAR
jgi:hypothetical protein